MKRSTAWLIVATLIVFTLIVVAFVFTQRLNEFDANLYATLTATR